MLNRIRVRIFMQGLKTTLNIDPQGNYIFHENLHGRVLNMHNSSFLHLSRLGLHFDKSCAYCKECGFAGLTPLRLLYLNL